MRRWFGGSGARSNDWAGTRDLLFGDLSTDQEDADESSPLAALARTDRAFAAANRDDAIQVLQSLGGAAEAPAIQELAAWQRLRRLGVRPPPDLATEVLSLLK